MGTCAQRGFVGPKLTNPDEYALAWELCRFDPDAWAVRVTYAPGGTGPYPPVGHALLCSVQAGLRRLLP